MISFFRQYRMIILLNGVLFGLCAGNILVSSGRDLIFYDEHDYVSIAANIAEKGMFSLDGERPTAFRAPAFPLLLSPFVSLGAGLIVLKLVNGLLLTAASFIFAVFLSRHFNPLTGVIASILVLFYPVLIYTSGTLYPQMLGALLLVLIVVCWMSDRWIGIRKWIALGILNGLLILTIPTFVFVAALIFVRLSVIRELKQALIMLSVIIIVLFPWTFRNAVTFDTMFFVSTNSGINLLLGNSEQTTPNAGTSVDIRQYVDRRPTGDESVVDANYRQEALQYVSDHPVSSLVLYARKFLNHFNYRNDIVTANVGSAWKEGVMLISYGLLLTILFIRFLHKKDYPLTDGERMILLLYLLGAVIQAVFFTRIRFRLPLDLLLIGVCAHSVAAWRHTAEGSGRWPGVKRIASFLTADNA